MPPLHEVADGEEDERVRQVGRDGDVLVCGLDLQRLLDPVVPLGASPRGTRSPAGTSGR